MLTISVFSGRPVIQEEYIVSNKPLKAIVLAAGKGTRMRTDGCDLPKVMRQAHNKPLLHYVLSALDFISPADTVLVVGYRKEDVLAAFPEYSHAEQAEQLGTGHAVQCAFAALPDFDGDVLVCCGDMPLITRETYQALVETHRANGNVCTMLTGTSSIDLPYGRVVRKADGSFQEIVEQKDCTPEQLNIRELNAGVYVFDAKTLLKSLSHLKNNNASGEYYLTDAPALMLAQGLKVDVCKRDLGSEIIGVNTPEQLAEVERVLDARK